MNPQNPDRLFKRALLGALLLMLITLAGAANLTAQEPDIPPAEPPPPPPGTRTDLKGFAEGVVLHVRQPKEIPAQPPPDPDDAPPLDQVETSSVEAHHPSHSGEFDASSPREIDRGVQSVTAVPPPPTLRHPNGTIDYNTPVYHWDPLEEATWFHLWVNDAAGTPIFQQWYQAPNICNLSLSWCRVWPSLELPDGAYRWWVAGWNSERPGDWSAGMDFSVIHSPPYRPFLWYPIRTHASMPTYSWGLSPSATWHWLWINDGVGNVVHKAWYRAHTDLDCDPASDRCSVTPPVELVPGEYTWWVKTWNSAGYGPWSFGRTFIYDLKPFAASSSEPYDGTCVGESLDFEWDGDSVATWYLLEVRPAQGVSTIIREWYSAADVCRGGICNSPHFDLAYGEYRWTVRTWNSYGYGPQSTTRDFRVDPSCGFDTPFIDSVDRWQANSGDWNLAGGDWYAVDGLANEWVSASYFVIYRDFRYEVRLWRDGCDACATGIYIRGTPEPLEAEGLWNSGYLFLFAVSPFGPQYSVFRFDPGATTILQAWTTTDTFADTSAWNRLRIYAFQGTIKFSINSREVWSGYDTTYATGMAGIAMSSDGTAGNRLWVDWATQETHFFPDTSADNVSPRQQAWNEAANANPRGSIFRAPSLSD